MFHTCAMPPKTKAEQKNDRDFCTHVYCEGTCEVPEFFRTPEFFFTNSASDLSQIKTTVDDSKNRQEQ